MPQLVCVQCKRPFNAAAARAQICEACASEQTIAVPATTVANSRPANVVRPPTRAAAPAKPATAKPAPMPAAPSNEALGPYAVMEELGRGAMGQVLKAWDNGLKREVAVKILLPDGAADAVSRERFIDEARITGRLDHPGIAPVYFLGEAAERGAFFSMKLVAGRTLGDLLERWHARDAAVRHDYPLPRLLSVFERVVETVAFAHAHGVIHRDIKPANIMVGTYGEVWVLDWGLAKAIDAAEPARQTGRPRKKVDPRDTNLTMDGMVVGTPKYMSPEQATGSDLDARSDLFSLGTVLYQVLTGRPPYEGTSAEVTLQNAADAKFKPVRRTATGRRAPEALAAITEKCMAYDPHERYADAHALLEDLRAYANGDAVAALPDTPLRKLQRAARQHARALTIGAAAAVLLLATTTALTLVIWQKNRKALDAEVTAKQERERAQTADAKRMQAELERERALNANAQKARVRLEAFEPYSRALDLMGRNIRPFEAAGLLQQALKTDPQFLEAQYLLGEALRLSGTPQQAAEEYLRANTLSRKLNARAHLQALLSAGFAYNSAGMYDKAEDAFKEAEEVSATDPLALVGKAYTLAHHRRLKEALTTAREAQRAGVEFWETNFGLAYVLSESVRDGVLDPAEALPEAITLLQAAQVQASRQAEILSLLATVHGFRRTAGDNEIAFELLSRAIALEPNNPTRHFNRALARINSDPDAAAADFATAVRRQLPPMLKTSYEMRLAYRAAAQEQDEASRTAKMEEAFRLSSQLRSGKRDWPPLVGNWLNIACELKKPDALVQPVLEQWARENPDYCEVFALRGLQFARKKQFTEARREVEAGLRVAPYNDRLRQLKAQLDKAK